jgi:hypothetical protein
MYKKIFTLTLILFLTNCSVPNWYKPQGYILFRQLPKGGTPGFNLGWIHGCESGLGSQFGGAFFLTWYTWKKDPDISSSNPDILTIKSRYKKELKKINWDNPAEVKKNFSDYNSIFWAAHIFCRHAVLGNLQSAGMEPALPGNERYDPAAHSLGNIWKIDGKGDTRYGAGGLW